MNNPLSSFETAGHPLKERAPQLPALLVWRASLRMALVSAAGVVAAGLMASGLAGCADMSGIAPQATVRDAASLGLGTAPAPATAPVAAVDAQWWRGFGDETLNGLVEQALQDSPNLRLAQARLARAQAVTESARSATGPQVGGQLDLTRQRYTANGAVPPPLTGSILNSGTAQLAGSWELDFFGKNRAALDAALGSARAAQADAQAARVLLASQVARTYFQLVRLNAQQDVAQRALAQREETLGLVRDRVSAGLDTRLELRQSEGGLPEARLQLETVREQMALTRNALHALLGQPGSTAPLVPSAPSAIKPIALAPVIPADLLGRRADVAAARWRVEAATRDVDNARTQFYPNINLVAFAGFSSLGLGQLFDAGSQQWGVGPALRLPVFESGRLRANLRGRTADLDAAVESYNAAVIDAVREVADQLASLQAIGRQQLEQRAAQDAAESAYDIAVQRYKAGLANYLNVLTAETGVLAQRRLAVDLAGRALETQVALARALGGGYGPEALPAAQDAPKIIAANAGAASAKPPFNP